MSETPRFVAIEGGYDWYDASVDYLVVPADLDLGQAKADYREWRKADPHLSFPEWLDQYLSFSEWLVEFRGARAADEIEVFQDE